MNDREIDFIKAHAPCYVYDADVIRGHADALLQAFQGFSILASVKTNPFPPVLRIFSELGIGADAASIGEVRAAIASGMDSRDIYYSAAGKTDEEIAEGLYSSVFTADSTGELERVSRIARERNMTVRIGLRVNPDFTLDDDHGVPGKFGVCEEDLPDLSKMLTAWGNVIISGLHVHMKSQQLDAERLGRSYERIYRMAEKTNELPGFEIGFVNFGGGVGIVYDESEERPLDLKTLSFYAKKVAERNRQSLRARLLVESGRFLTCAAGTYFTDVTDVKESRGKKNVIVRGGMNGFLRPVMTNVLNSLLPGKEFPPPEPLYTRAHSFEFDVLNEETERETYDICGCLCTAADVLLSNAYMKKARIGDLISVSKAGSYAYTLTPVLFSSHPAPAQYLLENGVFLSE